MAKQIITKLLDDLDGGEADETLTFALDGMGYAIDLSGKNSAELRDFLGRYIEAATRTGRVGTGPQLQRYPRARQNARQEPSFAEKREENSLIREWAIAQGYEIAERGRIPQTIIDAYTDRLNAKTVVAEVKKAARSRSVSFKPEKANA